VVLTGGVEGVMVVSLTGAVVRTVLTDVGDVNVCVVVTVSVEGVMVVTDGVVVHGSYGP
jgi:hypothetical protein